MKLLRDYKRIGWDFDQTLLNHPLSAEMWQFITENPFDQIHHIVTFRSGGMEHCMFSELYQQGSQLRAHHFDQVHNIGHNIWVAYTNAVTNSIPCPIEYLHWKGFTCAEYGIEVLIDDMTDSVMAGCQKYGIAYIHPDDLGNNLVGLE